MNRNPVLTLDVCFGELLREEQRITTYATMEHNISSIVSINMAYAAQGKNKTKYMCFVQCHSCKGFGHMAKACTQNFCNYYK